MSKKKKKPEKNGLSTGAIVALVIGAVLIVAIITSSLTPNYSNFEESTNQKKSDTSYNYYEQEESCPEGYTLCGDKCFSCAEGYYLGSDCECYPTKETQEDLAYEKADSIWRQHVEILENDEEKLSETIENYCQGQLTGEQINNCVSQISPRLNVYSTHIVNAQSFMTNEGDVFSNKLELLSWLDEKAVYTHTLANSLNTMVENYNSNLAQQQSQYQIDEESLETILKILAMAI
jgi:hypothetical protein